MSERSLKRMVLVGRALLSVTLFGTACDSSGDVSSTGGGGTSGVSSTGGAGTGAAGAGTNGGGGTGGADADAGVSSTGGDGGRGSADSGAGADSGGGAGGADADGGDAAGPNCGTAETECSESCRDTRTDPQNCGGCGSVCSNEHGTTSCVASSCAPICDLGFDDCDGSAANGCETVTQNDPLNCGACGDVCLSAPNANAVCVDSACSPYLCETGFADCNLDPSDGCEVNALGDAAHCGGCGVDCLGSGCNAGACGDQPITLAAGQSAPMGIGVNGLDVYWSTQGGEVLKVPIDGGTPVSLVASEGGGNYLVVDAGSAYWTGDDALMKVPVSGGTPTLLTEVPDWAPYGLASDASSVYWTDYRGHAVRKVSTDGGTPTTLATLGTNPTGIAVDTVNVYWLDGFLKSVPLAGGPITVHSPAGGLALAVDGANAYWVDDDNVMMCALASCTPTILASGQDDPRSVVTDATSVYWVNLGTSFNDRRDGSIMKVSIAGGTVTQLASWQNFALNIAVDASNVYWTTLRGGTVMKLGK